MDYLAHDRTQPSAQQTAGQRITTSVDPGRDPVDDLPFIQQVGERYAQNFPTLNVERQHGTAVAIHKTDAYRNSLRVWPVATTDRGRDFDLRRSVDKRIVAPRDAE